MHPNKREYKACWRDAGGTQSRPRAHLLGVGWSPVGGALSFEKYFNAVESNTAEMHTFFFTSIRLIIHITIIIISSSIFIIIYNIVLLLLSLWMQSLRIHTDHATGGGR